MHNPTNQRIFTIQLKTNNMKKNIIILAIVAIVIAAGLYLNEVSSNERGYTTTSFFTSNK